LCGKPERKHEAFAILRGYLEVCVRARCQFTPGEVGRIRLILGGIVTKRGTPDSPRCQALRRKQAEQNDRPTTADFARVLLGRLTPLPQDEPLTALDAVAAPVAAAEAGARPGLAGQPIPEALVGRLRRGLAAPVETLVEFGVIPSAEVLA